MSWKTSALIVIIAVASPNAAAPLDVIPPAVPANLEVPSGHKAFLMARGEGTQNYICMPTATGAAWSFLGPQATLFDGNSEQVTTHFLSPNPAENGTPRATWQHSRDSSSTWAVAIASSTDSNYVAAGAIPWLLLRVTGVQPGTAWGDKLVGTAYIQRVNTAGGVQPATGCAAAADIGKRAMVPYSTDYIFYR